MGDEKRNQTQVAFGSFSFSPQDCTLGLVGLLHFDPRFYCALSLCMHAKTG